MTRWFFVFALSLFLFCRLECRPIIFAMPPRTASNYIPISIAKGLNREVTRNLSAEGGFPHQAICPKLWAGILKKDLVSRGHIDASKHNLDLIKSAGGKVIVCVRDLRQNVVSWTYHQESLIKTGQAALLKAFQASHPKGFCSWSFSQKLEWNIQNFVPATLKWIEDWLDASEKNPGLILFVTYEEFLENREQFVHKVLNFLELEDSCFTNVYVPPSKELHFRRGKADEWKQVLMPEQVSLIQDMIPSYFYDIFNWEKR